jgi:hypothetical protein
MNKFKVNFIQCYNKKRMPISHWIKFIINETLSLTALNFESKSQDPKSTSELGGPVRYYTFSTVAYLQVVEWSQMRRIAATIFAQVCIGIMVFDGIRSHDNNHKLVANVAPCLPRLVGLCKRKLQTLLVSLYWLTLSISCLSSEKRAVIPRTNSSSEWKPQTVTRFNLNGCLD